ncbi:hypothetical protein [Moorena sp. SIO3F7]|nr:hypothetical protein [Moorena sp. SIO3F7]
MRYAHACAFSRQPSAVSLFYSKTPIALRARCANSSVAISF